MPEAPSPEELTELAALAASRGHVDPLAKSAYQQGYMDGTAARKRRTGLPAYQQGYMDGKNRRRNRG